MTTRTTARPTTGAGPTPKDHNPVTDNRTYERLLIGVRNGTIRLTPDYRYQAANGTDMDHAVYEAAADDKRWITLTPGMPPQITDAGRAWLAARYEQYGPSPTRPVFLAPDPEAAAQQQRTGPYRGERINTARLTDAQVRDIKARATTGTTDRELAAEFGVGESTIRRIRTGTNWRHVA
ncbi:hypothetical protein AB0B63_18505 [Micromonospora sp. NPDC049081]|uniref:hypothetical protein n=1 Tax=Micromonospora sp. NPDC049081 TaxID=3155150 RepID=UPI0033DCA5D9